MQDRPFLYCVVESIIASSAAAGADARACVKGLRICENGAGGPRNEIGGTYKVKGGPGCGAIFFLHVLPPDYSVPCFFRFDASG